MAYKTRRQLKDELWLAKEAVKSQYESINYLQTRLGKYQFVLAVVAPEIYEGDVAQFAEDVRQVTLAEEAFNEMDPLEAAKHRLGDFLTDKGGTE